MFDHGQAIRKRYSVHAIEVGSDGWGIPYRVLCKIDSSGYVEILSVEAFLEFFQAYVDVPLHILKDHEKFEELRDCVSDWHNAEQVADLNRIRARRLEYNNDDPNSAA